MGNQSTVETVRARVVALIKQYRIEQIRKLPPVPQLCVILGCSPVTLGKAVRGLVGEGILEASAASGTQICSMPVAPAPLSWQAPGRPEKLSALCAAIRSDIYAGVLPESPLPSMKELAGRYGVCYRTMRSALQSLCDYHFLVRRGKHYTSALSKPARASACVGLLLYGASGDNLPMVTPRTHEHLRMAEQQCNRLGIRLILLPHLSLPPVGTSDWRRLFDDSLSDTTRLGFMVWNAAISWSEPLCAFVSSGVASGKPVSVLDECGGDVYSRVSAHPLLRVVSMAVTDRSATDVARYLIVRGHRHIAFFHPFQDIGCRDDRLEGLAAEYAKAGLPEAITAYEAGFVTAKQPFEQESWSVQRAGGALRRALGVEELGSTALDHLTAALRDAASAAMGENQLHSLLGTWFEEALAHPEITAWVCYNDVVAREAMRFLRDRKDSVAGKVSLISFDDSQTASSMRFSSYNFNGLAAIRSCLNHILHPFSTGRLSRAAIEELQGFVSDRGTVTTLNPLDRRLRV